MSWLRPALIVASKDLHLELRTRDILTSVGLFALLVIVVASFAFPTWGEAREGVAAGLLWMAFLFAALLGMGRSMTIEKQDGCLDGLLASPAPREAIFFGKLLANLTFAWAVELVVLPVFVVLLQIRPGAGLGLLALTAFLGTLGLVTVGTLFSAMAVNTKSREAILPLLVMPVAIPVMIAAVEASAAILGGRVGDAQPWLLLIGGYDALFLMVALATFPYATEA